MAQIEGDVRVFRLDLHAAPIEYRGALPILRLFRLSRPLEEPVRRIGAAAGKCEPELAAEIGKPRAVLHHDVAAGVLEPHIRNAAPGAGKTSRPRRAHKVEPTDAVRRKLRVLARRDEIAKRKRLVRRLEHVEEPKAFEGLAVEAGLVDDLTGRKIARHRPAGP